MNILHILSQREVTGAETYAVALAQYQLKQGHQVFIISDTLHTPTDAVYYPQPIDKRSYKQRIINIRFIKKIIKKHQIDVVNTHSRAGSWVAYFAVKGTQVPLVSTVHGRQHLHTSTSLYDIYGDRVIAICEHMRTHLIDEVKINPEKIEVIRNGFDAEKFEALASELPPPYSNFDFPVISIIGRTSGYKGEKTAVIIKDVLPVLLHRYPNLHVNIIGGKAEQLGEQALNDVNEINHQFGHRIHLIGHVNNVLSWMRKSSVVIGSGRVAMEACLIHVPAIALGESSYHGLITPENKTEMMSANFGDIQPHVQMPAIDFDQLKADIIQFLDKREVEADNKQWLQHYFGLDKIAKQIEDAYYSAIFQKKHPHWIPVLMYHMITETVPDTPHRIYVTKDVFEKQLKSLDKRGFTSITFKELEEYRTQRKAMSSFPKKPIILTFDDGYEDNYIHAFPLLKRYGHQAVIFALGDRSITYNTWDVAKGAAKQPLMTNEQRLEMQAYGVEFGAHTLTHPSLTELSIDEVLKEVTDSKFNIEEDLGVSVISFANPYGHTNKQVKEAIAQAGYTYAVATDSGPVGILDDRMQIYRVAVFPDDQGAKFEKKTSSWYRRYIRLKYKR